MDAVIPFLRQAFTADHVGPRKDTYAFHVVMYLHELRVPLRACAKIAHTVLLVPHVCIAVVNKVIVKLRIISVQQVPVGAASSFVIRA